MIADALSGGFTEAPLQSARAFREILEASAIICPLPGPW
jgi:alpha-D-ribose 1-methylphosphonate 5-triphosphate synthase subunit PhnH